MPKHTLPTPDTNEGRLLAWFAQHDWQTARDAADSLDMSLNGVRSALFTLRRRNLLLSRTGERSRIDGKSGRRPTEWAVSAAVGAHLPVFEE
jgi:predicted ArsR family transcriptional regulator